MEILFFAFIGLIWGSFLNVVAYRLMNNQSVVTPRSQCPKCNTLIAWYDNIPVLSWLVLRGRCRTCHKPISILYPLIEILTALLAVLLYVNRPTFLPAYALFFSALLVTIRTDLEYLLICRITTLYLVPLGWIFSAYNLLPISPMQSVIGSFIGFFSLFILAHLYYWLTGKQGIGEGDFDLLALIGAFTGPLGVFYTALLGSWIGSIISILYILIAGKNMHVKLPFGPFLAAGAICYVLWKVPLEQFLTSIAL